MTISIIGSGRIGGGLARAWRAAGHEVIIGARRPDDPELQARGSALGVRIASTRDAIATGAVVVLAIPYGAMDEVVAAAESWSGKVVIDCTNAVHRGPAGMEMQAIDGGTATEALARRLPGAAVFKSFNAQGAENLANPVYDGVRASNFYCGDDAQARPVVRQLVEDAGFDPVDAGPLRNARLLETLMLLWIAAAQTGGSREVAFRLLHR